MKKTETAIKIDNVTKSFEIVSEKRDTIKSRFFNLFRPIRKKKFIAIDRLTLEINKGEFISIIGKNGSGKSTLLKLISQIYLPDSGNIVTRGKIIPFLELGVGFNPELSARENIYLNGTILGMTRKFINEKFNEIVDFAEIREFLDVPIKNFSSGMQVRLAFSIAIKADADIYILDEVLAVGDMGFQEKCFEYFRKMKKLGKTIIFVSHSLSQVEEFSDRAVLLVDGKIAKEGEVRDIIFHYHELVNKSEIKSENRSPEKERPGTGQVRISKIAIEDQNKKDGNNFTVGDNIKFRIDYKINKGVENLHIGLGIYDEKTGFYLFGTNTKYAKILINKEKRSISFNIYNTSLLSGKYFVNFVVFGESETKYYDFYPKGTIFTVNTKSPHNGQRGNILVSSKWEQ
ncbi:ABC transporter ATP-binding protein [Candidatus Dojkabacteria bacterium]|nr:ABC transporter ATP-binding protein [Candidatus Dojkabacteria bacterium]